MQTCFHVLCTQILEALTTNTKIFRIFAAAEQTNMLIVTEIWINDNQKITLNFLNSNHHFVHQSKSKLTQLTRWWSMDMGTKYVQA